MQTDNTPRTPAETNPAPAQQQQGVDWRNLDFASDCLIVRAAQPAASAPAKAG
ncbi:hypothetical protein GCM10011360_30780 [Primorskyibacter flagellatus]|uniref:Uncharacterized protein n=1 Tax=Primorskyibacter flagellatus TaxID=1387277 RepID=A0A917EH66_9RHOB|nr:hypothetical protein [Primorskyibacter flagellatus]GGE41129.1 hypothetical protein GCM10011360_30780 [Primorskyibacter flagellatus]